MSQNPSTDCRGTPRLQYKRTVHYLEGNPTESDTDAVWGIVRENRSTISYSLDDAMLGDLDSRTVIVWGVEAQTTRASEIEDFRDTFYPGVILEWRQYEGTPPPDETHRPQTWLHLAAIGLHPNDPNGSFMTDLGMLRDAKIEGFIFTSNSDIDPDSLGILLQQTSIPPENVVIRLFMPGTDPNVINPSKYVELHRAWIKHGLSHGVRKYQLWNEPNLDQSLLDAGRISSDQMEWPSDAPTFASVFRDVGERLRAEYGADIQIGFPGLSPQDNAPRYYDACRGAIEQFADWISVHTYFSTSGSGLFGIESRTGGLYWQNVLELIPPDIPIWITEFADNGDGPDLERANRTLAYFVSECPTRIKGLACYISQDSNFPKQEWVSNPHILGLVGNRPPRTMPGS